MAYLERTKLVDENGVVISPATDAAITEGELIHAIEALRMAVHSLTRTIGYAMPDTAGRLRVNVDGTSIGTVTTVTTLSNQSQIGGYNATEQIPSLMRLGTDSLRRNIIVS